MTASKLCELKEASSKVTVVQGLSYSDILKLRSVGGFISQYKGCTTDTLFIVHRPVIRKTVSRPHAVVL